MQPPRMTTRRWMIVVALAAIVFAYFALSLRMWYLASNHETEQRRPMSQLRIRSSHALHVRRAWHHEMAERYRRAMWFPWIAFEPAPTPP